ncbi:hypothetical protein K469DRAFT_705728 [Zopfia rhizophila CBS 207.26]|uniref:Uncharacterized protein n=1 Tax=Zopfia rhizophila CBS 207.26 TaxID=1314779 RepID=A0A6A6E5H8_9PEZI|nr:hypothetical protein K469DRAFT_705728 [Zopfia rhizophila CBS 207.26]
MNISETKLWATFRSKIVNGTKIFLLRVRESGENPESLQVEIELRRNPRNVDCSAQATEGSPVAESDSSEFAYPGARGEWHNSSPSKRQRLQSPEESF